MNILSYVYGLRGNAKVKRARHGMEKDWNRYDEPFRKLLKGGNLNRSKRRLAYRAKKFKAL